MRILLALLFALVATPAFAQGWEYYDNGRFGYGVDVPPGFYSQGESDNGDGVTFAAQGKPSYLTIWGGNLMERGFCPSCGTPLFSRSDARPHLLIVRAGALDDPELLAPQGTIWTDEAPSWAHIDTDLPQFPRQPPPLI